MSISKVIMPTTANGDYDFLAFSFNGLHSWDDFKIIRVSDGNRYNTELGPQSQDKTAENPGGDGMYYFNTTHKQKVFNINFAFEEIDDITIRNMKRWLSSKELGDLWFEEDPYKVYSAKVTGQPTLKYIPFDKYLEDGATKRIYRGEGSVQFTAFYPYAHTPDKIYERTTDANGFTKAGDEIGDGKNFDSYLDFRNKDEWETASGLTSSTGSCTGENPGDLPAPFIFTKTGNIGSDTQATVTFRVGELSITIPAESSTTLEDETTYTHYKNLTWDSKTGIVSAYKSGDNIGTDKPKPIFYTGESLGSIPVGGLTSDELVLNDGTLNYHYWYY